MELSWRSVPGTLRTPWTLSTVDGWPTCTSPLMTQYSSLLADTSRYTHYIDAIAVYKQTILGSLGTMIFLGLFFNWLNSILAACGVIVKGWVKVLFFIWKELVRNCLVNRNWSESTVAWFLKEKSWVYKVNIESVWNPAMLNEVFILALNAVVIIIWGKVMLDWPAFFEI